VGPGGHPAVAPLMSSLRLPAGSRSPTLIVMGSPSCARSQQKAQPRIVAETCCTQWSTGEAALRVALLSVAARKRNFYSPRMGGRRSGGDMKKSKGARDRRVTLLVATSKGLWQLHEDATRRSCRLTGPQFLGHTVHHCVADPRDSKVILAAARTGHLGPTVFRSTDRGRTWHEAKQPPAFREGSGRVVDHTFWLTPGHSSTPGIWFAGSSPQGLFRSDDGGATWHGVDGLNEHPQRKTWCGGDQDGTPDGPKLHSILIDPRDAQHMYIGMSSGGVFESTDGGA